MSTISNLKFHLRYLMLKDKDQLSLVWNIKYLPPDSTGVQESDSILNNWLSHSVRTRIMYLKFNLVDTRRIRRYKKSEASRFDRCIEASDRLYKIK